ncbi:MAG: hypothetical protein JXR26_01825, partial [Balneolaceae bacterium]|nr:hypothetical protein [Balneolaceae bacterium]
MFIISSCDNQAVQPEQQTNEFVIPQYGDTPLPGLPDYDLKGDNTSKKKDHKKPSKSTADLLKHYVAKHKKVSFAAVTGRWKPNKQK